MTADSVPKAIALAGASEGGRGVAAHSLRLLPQSQSKDVDSKERETSHPEVVFSIPYHVVLSVNDFPCRQFSLERAQLE